LNYWYLQLSLVGKAIKNLHLPEQCIIAAIIREEKMVVPRGGIKFNAGDEVLVITDTVGAEELVELFTPNHS